MKKIHVDRLRDNIEHSVNSDVAAGIIAGAAIFVAQNGATIYSAYHGYKNSETKEKLTPNTLFRLASMTKPITATAALIQMERGAFSLNDKVSKFIPSFKDMYVGKIESDGCIAIDRKAESKIRILHLLTHSSGLISDTIGNLQYNNIPPEAKRTLASIVDYYGEHCLLTFSPMEKTIYSGLAAFDVVARLVELTSDMPFEDFVLQNVFAPLEMKNTTFTPSEEQWSNMVSMHNKTEKGSETFDMGRHVFADIPLTYHTGGAGLAGTGEDYMHFAQMLLQEGEYNGHRFVSQEMIKIMHTAYIPEKMPGWSDTENWGLGVRVITKETVLPVGCFGWSGAYGTHFWVDPVNKITSVYMKNSFFDGGSEAQTSRRFEQSVMASL